MKIRPKLIALDLDGTILHDDKTISAFTYQVLQQCRERGIKLAIATARPVRTAKEYCQQLRPAYTVCHNGAVIVTKDTTWSYGISSEDTRRILNFLANQTSVREMAVEIHDCLYANYEADKTWPGLFFIRSNLQQLPEENADKLLFNFTVDDDLSGLYREFAKDFNIEIADGTMGMIMSKTASKLSALRQITRIEKMNLEDVLYFGDDDNDVESVRQCGMGIAVANSNARVKAAADAICEENNEDGVARWVQAHVLD